MRKTENVATKNDKKETLMRYSILFAIALTGLSACQDSAPQQSAADKVNALADRYYEWTLERSPEQAYFSGVDWLQQTVSPRPPWGVSKWSSRENPDATGGQDPITTAFLLSHVLPTVFLRHYARPCWIPGVNLGKMRCSLSPALQGRAWSALRVHYAE